MAPRVGLLTIGQSPRPDLAAPVARRCPGAELVWAGALDGLTAASLPRVAPDGGPGRSGAYPLTTRLADGTRVTLDEAALEPLVRAALARLEADGVVATLLLCAGPFATVHGERPFLRPHAIATGLLREAGVGRVGVLVPVEEQRAPAAAKYAADGFATVTWAAELEAAAARLPGWLAAAEASGGPLGAIVLDYVGHDEERVAALARAAGRPVIDLGLVGAAVLAAIV